MAQTPSRLHHSALVVKDLAVSRTFYEGILGLPLVATWCETSERLGDYCHAFFALGDDSAVALFQFARDDVYQLLKRPDKLSAFHHLALNASQSLQDEIRGKAEAAGIEHHRVDHGMCISLYLDDPDGHKLEITCDCEQVVAQAEFIRHRAPEELERWLAGDRRTNNDIRETSI